MNIGFIGTGSMGAAMIPHLVDAGHRVGVWNRSLASAEAIKGVTVLSTPAEAFRNEVVLTMLADDAAVRSVVIDSSALAAAHPACVHAMMATISPDMADELLALHRAAGVAYVAAPVMGIPAVAARAELNILVAGDLRDIAVVQPLFDLLGQKTWVLGTDPKHANIAKIAGNMMITLAIEAMGEATALTESYGLKAADFLNVVTNTTLSSPSYKRYGGYIASNTYTPGFKLTLGLKDINLALDAARTRNAQLPAVEIVRQNMIAAVDAGFGSMDWSVLAKQARRRGGLSEDVA